MPAYRLHRASGQAVVTLNGVDHYLGRWDSPPSKAEYDRLIAEWLAGGRRLAVSNDRMLVKELVLGYDRHMRATASVAELERIRAAPKPVRELYGNTAAAKFGPVAYKAVRTKMIEAEALHLHDPPAHGRRSADGRLGGSRTNVLPADRLERIKAVPGLRARRDGVKPQRKVKPAPEEHIDAILPHVTPRSGRWSKSRA